MKYIVCLIFISSFAFSQSKDTTLAKSDMLKSIASRHERASKEFQYTLTPDQLKLQKAIEALAVQYQTIDMIKQDSIRVKR